MFNVLFVDEWMTHTDAETGDTYEEARGGGECVAVVSDLLEAVAVLQQAIRGGHCPDGWEGVITDCHHRRVPELYLNCAAAVLLAHRDQQDALERDAIRPSIVWGR